MVCLLLWAVGVQMRAALSWGHDSWQLSELLINYAGGFVRRGLIGALLGLVAGVTGIQANHLAIGTGLVSYGLLVGWFLRRSTRMFPAVLILSCIALGFPAYQDSIIRKDCLGLLLLLGCLNADDSRLARPLKGVTINLIAGLSILSHEAFAFYALPALVLFTRGGQQPLTGIGLLRRCLLVLPAAGCFALASCYHGTPEVARAVNASWIPLWRAIDPGISHPEIPAASIQALGWTSGQGLSLGLNLLTSGFYQPLAWAALFAVSFALVVLFTGRDADARDPDVVDARIRIAAILLAQFLFIAPLFLLGYDYGRWLFFWVAGSMMLHTAGRRAPRWLESRVARLFVKARLNELCARVPAKDWYLLLFGVPVCWNLYSFIFASPVVRHLRIIWSWL